MTELVFDDTGARYYETGASKGVFFPLTGGAYVWNGLVAVNLDPIGGESEEFWYDGVKTMERDKPDKFQATIQAVNTPREFDVCEGVYQTVPGMKTHFNKRIRFHLVWETKIGNDESPNHATKLHIVYNALVKPTPASYQTLTDVTTPDVRSFVISAMPCGSTPYYTFDSRDGSYAALWAQILLGNLPTCTDLAALIGVVPPNEEIDCINIVTDFNSYNPGQILDEDLEVDETEVFIEGVINNGLDIVEFPVDGAYDANDSLAEVVGAGDVLADADDATYIKSTEADLGYTLALPLLTGGYGVGTTFELHIRASMTGDINPDDPDTMNAEAQVHISTDADGELTIGGFSDGAQEGMAFRLSDVFGTIVDYVIPLRMGAWIHTDINDVVAALEAGAYLNVLGASNFNPDPALDPPEFRVYEASILMLNSTDGDRYLRPDATSGVGFTEKHIRTVPGGSTDQETAFTTYVDFKIKSVPSDDTYDGVVVNIVEFEGDVPGTLKIEMVGAIARAAWYDEGSVLADVAFDLIEETWYKARIYWTWGTANIKVWARDASSVIYLIDRTVLPSTTPTAQAKHNTGKVGA